jgi:hypothetical protein
MSIRYRRLHFTETLVLPRAARVMMSWCKLNGYNCEVSFGRNKVPMVKIRKVKS